MWDNSVAAQARSGDSENGIYAHKGVSLASCLDRLSQAAPSLVDSPDPERKDPEAPSLHDK
jgi:hypothetical protein